MSDFQSLVVHSCFDLVRQRVIRPGSPITDVLFVESDELMCEMAGLLTVPANRSGHQRFQRWFEEGRIVVGSMASRPDRTSAETHQIDLFRIDGAARCEALFLPPYFLVRLQDALMIRQEGV